MEFTSTQFVMWFHLELKDKGYDADEDGQRVDAGGGRQQRADEPGGGCGSGAGQERRVVGRRANDGDDERVAAIGRRGDV